MDYKSLSDICSYVNERIATNDINLNQYISTENMIPNKGGVTKSKKLPNGKTTKAYKKGDILISNIRPYFRKIWHATQEGGCSGDILVVRAKQGVNSRFLYYLLSSDNFFEFDNATSKGTKMPRGDKKAIMQYRIPDLSPENEQKVASILGSLDKRIILNEKINHHLFNIARSIWIKKFYNKSPNGKLKNIIDLFDSKRIPLSNKQRDSMDKIYPYYGATSIMDYVDQYLFEGIYLLLGEDGTVINKSGFPILQYVWGKFWANNHAHILKGKNGFNVESLYLLLSTTNISSIVTGAVQLKINQTNLKSIDIYIPPKQELEDIKTVITPIFEKIRNLDDENKDLSKIRDILLPQLITGKMPVKRET
ncbi:restriction endonuclease subunit S [Tetragenococcus koreensis]|uniref:restriction endonuclease subunit S n=1 Tax=Tetragenococcus koreensis TaxID=290335 RepID=UPI001F3DD7D3|nr:restriction endonuclease subunit S [Tetragenococcus koreensis]MCF1618831.1 restriction endonuclease subunit S [Tetragenococcus koreensis]MCF1642430.1 restriction endonuclease subunit S [Tetragenococcus koreensis]MCF1656312.1 restriction endonuclease subunit S [Tetragenococcus koreensis]